MRSATSSRPRSAAARCSRPGSGNAPRGGCCCRGRQRGRRPPLWQQRQRSAQLLGIATQYPGFPIVLETVRECLQDVFDVPALVSLLEDLAARRVRVVEVETPTPSPFGKSLLFRYVGASSYEGGPR